MMNTYKVRGTAMRYGGTEHIVIVEEAGSRRPVMMQAYGDMMRHLMDVGNSDAEEKYMDLDFIYSGWCTLYAILVPSSNDRVPAKAVIFTTDGSVKVFGTQEIVDAPNPPPMSLDDWHAAQAFALENEDINLRRCQ